VLTNYADLVKRAGDKQVVKSLKEGEMTWGLGGVNRERPSREQKTYVLWVR